MILSDIAANRDLGLDSERYFPVGNTARLAHMLARPYEATSAEAQMIKWRFDWDKAAESTAKIYRAFMPPSAQVVRHQDRVRSEEHTSELQSLMRISYAVFCLKKKNIS